MYGDPEATAHVLCLLSLISPMAKVMELGVDDDRADVRPEVWEVYGSHGIGKQVVGNIANQLEVEDVPTTIYEWGEYCLGRQHEGLRRRHQGPRHRREYTIL